MAQLQQCPVDGVVRFYNFLPEAHSFLEEVLAGLSLPQKTLPRKYCYDARGCALFEQLCNSPEYYCVRAELALMREHAAAMAKFLGPDCQLIEFGGSARETTRILIEQLRPPLYVPVDPAAETMQAAATGLAQAFPWLNICGVRADYGKPFTLPEFVGVPIRKKAVYFPAATIGSYVPQQALELLVFARRMVGPEGALLVGVDLKKDKLALAAAHDDAAGLNAAFSLNLLARINRELGSDFQPRRFRYRISYDEDRGCIESHLESLASQFVRVGGRRFDFGQGETMLTGISCKYGVEEFRELAQRAGFAPGLVWTNAGGWFSVLGMTAA
jgi:L-histidine Nalpha-methyltransferase